VLLCVEAGKSIQPVCNACDVLIHASAIFQAGSLIVLVAEVRTRAFLASLVPVIVNTVLNEHQLVLDIVAFVAFGDFPKSRLGEKQRGKVLGNWVSRKMRTIAQFSIRDPDAEGSVSTVGPEDGMGRRGSGQSGVPGGSMTRMPPGSSLRHSESITHMPVAEEPGEMENEILTLHTQHPGPSPERSDSRNDATPTNERPMHLNTTTDYSPIDGMSYDSPADVRRADYTHDYQMRASYGAPPEAYNPYDIPDTEPVPHELEASGGGLRVANRSSDRQSDDWEQEALRSLNLGGR
jgi:hypothetical protein